MSPGRRCAQTRPSMRPSDGRGSACRSVRVASSGENWCCPTISLVGSSVGSDHRKADLGQRTRLEKHVDVVEVGYVTENNEPMVIKVSTVTGADNKAQLQVKGKKVDESDQESARESTGSGSTDQYETYDIDENTEYSSAEEEEEIRERKGYKKEVEGTEGSPAKKRRPDQKQVNKFSVIDPRRQASQEEEEHRNCCDNSEVGGDSSSSGNLVQEAAYSRPRDKITTSYSQPITKGKSDFVATRHSRSLPLPNWLLRRKPSRKFKRANPNCERYRSSEVMPRCRSRDRTKCCRCSSKEDEDEDDEDDDSSRPEKCGPGCKKALPVGISLQPSPHRRSHGKKYSDRNNAKFSKALTPIDPFNTNFFFGHTIDETILEMMHTLSLLKYNGSTDQKKPNLSLCPAKQSHISSALTGNLMVQQSTFLRNALGTTVDEVLLSSYSRIRTMFQSKESKNEQEEHERSLRAEESELGLSSCTEETTYKPTPDLDKLSGLAIDDTVDVVNWLRDEYVALAEDEKLAKRHKKPSPGPLSPESLRQRRYVLDCLTQVMRKKKEMEDRKKDKQKTRTSDQRKRKGAAMITMAPNNCPCASPSPCEHGTIPALLVQATPSEVARIKKLAQQSDGTTMFQPQNFSPTFADPARILNPAEEMPSLPHPEGIKTCEYVSMETKETNDDGPIVQELHFNKNAHFDSGQSDSLTYNSGYSFMTHGSRRHTVSTSYDSTISISNSSSTQCSRCFGSYQYGNRTESCLSCISVSTGRKHRRKARPFTPTQYTKTTEYQYSPSQSSDSEMPSSYEPDMRYVENQTSSDSTSDFSEISRCEWNKRRRERLSRNAPCLRKNSEKKLSDKHLLCTYMTDKPFESSLEQLNFISSFTDSPDKFEEHSPNTQSFADGSTTEDGESPPISPSQVPLKHLSESNEKSEGLITKPRDCVIKPPDCVFKTPDCVIPRPGDAVNVMNICNEGNAMNNCNEGNQTCYKNTSEKTENQKSHRRCRWTNFSSSPKAEITANSGTLPNGREVGCVSGSLRHRLMEEVKSRVLMAKSISHTSQKQESNKDRLPEKCNETPNSTIPVNNGLKIMPGPSDLNSNMNYCPPREPENKESSCRPETKSNTRERNGETLATVPRDIVEELEIYFQRNNNAYGMSRSQENRPYTKDQNKAFSPKFVRKIPHRPEFQPHHQIRNDRASSNVHRQGEITCKSSYPQSRIESPKCRPLDENCKEFLSHPILKDRLTPNMYGQQDETTNHPYPQSKVRAQCMKFCEKMENHKMYSPNPETKDTSPNNHKLKKETPTCCEPTTQTIEKTPRIHEEIKTHKQCFPLRVFKERISPLIHKKQDEMPKCSCTKLQIRDPSPNCCEEVVSGEHTSPSRVMKCRISPSVNQQEELISKPPHAVTEEREHTQKCHEKTEYQRQMPQCREQMSKPPHTEEREQAQKCHEKTEYQRQMPQCREQVSKPPHTAIEEREQAQKCHDKTEYHRQMPQCREQVSKPPHTAIEEREQAQKCHDKTEYHRQLPQCREQVSKPPHTAIEEREQTQKCHEETQYHRQTAQCREQVSKPPHSASEEREQTQKCHEGTEYHRQMSQCREQVSKPPQAVIEEKEQAQKCHEKTEYHRQMPQCRVLKDELSPNREEYLTQGEIQTVNSSSHSAGKCCSPQHQTCENGCCNPNEGNEHHQDHPPRSKLENRPLLLPPRYEQECQKQCSQLKCHVRNPSSLSITSSDHRRVNNRPRSVKSVVRSIEEWSSQDSTSYDFSARSRRTSSKASNDGQSCIKLRLENTTSLSEELCSNATTTDASNDTSNDTLNNTRQHCSEIKLEPLEHDEESYIVPKSCVSPMNAPEVPDSSSVHFVSLTRNAVVDLSEALLAPQEAEIKCSETERLEKLENTNEVPKAPTKGTAEGDGLNQGRHTLNPDQELIMNLPLSPIRISQTQSDTQASVRFGQDVKERRPRQHAYTLVDNIANRRLKKDKRTVERDSNFTPETKNTIPNLNSGQGKSEPSVEDLVAAIYRANVFYASHNMERTWNNFTKSEITPPCLDKVAPPQRTHSNNSETKGKEIDEMREEQKDQNVENKPPDVISKEDEKVQNIENKPSEVKPTKENKNVPKASSDEKVKRKEVKKTPKNDELHSTKSQTNLHSRKTKEAREIRKKRSATKVGDKNKPSHKGVFVTYANKEGWQSTSKRSLVATAPNSNESHGSKPHEKRHRERNVRLHEHVSDKRLLIKPNATQSKPMRLFSYLTSRRQNEELCREHRMLKVMHMSAHTRYGARMHHSSVVRYPPMEKESLISPVVSKDLRRERYKMHDERALIPKRENNISSPLARRLNNHIQNLSARYRKSVAGEKVRGRHSYLEGTVSIPPPENIRKIHSSPEENRIMTGELRKRRNNASLDRSSRRFNPRSRDGSKSSARMSLMQIAKNPPFGLHRRLPVQNQISATFQIPQDSPQDSDETQKRRKRRSKQKVGNESSSKDVNKPEKMEDKTTETELRGKKKTKPSGGPQKQVAAKASPTKVLWAITRINIFEDNSRTYEVMKPTYKTPKKIPSTTEGLFALTPQ